MINTFLRQRKYWKVYIYIYISDIKMNDGKNKSIGLGVTHSYFLT